VNKLPPTHSKQAKKQEKQVRQEQTKSSPRLPVVIRRQVKIVSRWHGADCGTPANEQHQ